MLAEMYTYLKQEYPTHGLEIVFISSDRDYNSFEQYYSSMPWLAMPFASLAIYKHVLSSKYEVRGIPALVILDSMSGEIVVSTNQSRQEVSMACSCGDTEISNLFLNWLGRIPSTSRELADILATSCTEEVRKNVVQDEQSELYENKYLIREQFLQRKLRIDTLVQQLIEDGMDEVEALEAACDIEAVSSQTDSLPTLEAGPLDGLFHHVEETTGYKISEDPERIARRIARESGALALTTVLSTLMKYLENAKKTPWNTKFHSLNLSFKFVDYITRYVI
jgi:Thioredoxin-like